MQVAAQAPTNVPPSLFGILAAGQPVLTTPQAFVAPASFVYQIVLSGSNTGTQAASTAAPVAKQTHVAVFFLPDCVAQLPAGKAAAIYTSTAAPAFPPTSFSFVAAIGRGKESCVLQLDAGSTGDGGGRLVAIGISIENEATVEACMRDLTAKKTGAAGTGRRLQKEDALMLGQKIVLNAFNHLASFGRTVQGVELVPFKALEDWWRKYQDRMRNDAGFMERLLMPSED